MARSWRIHTRPPAPAAWTLGRSIPQMESTTPVQWFRVDTSPIPTKSPWLDGYQVLFHWYLHNMIHICPYSMVNIIIINHVRWTIWSCLKLGTPKKIRNENLNLPTQHSSVDNLLVHLLAPRKPWSTASMTTLLNVFNSMMDAALSCHRPQSLTVTPARRSGPVGKPRTGWRLRFLIFTILRSMEMLDTDMITLNVL